MKVLPPIRHNITGQQHLADHGARHTEFVGVAAHQTTLPHRSRHLESCKIVGRLCKTHVGQSRGNGPRTHQDRRMAECPNLLNLPDYSPNRSGIETSTVVGQARRTDLDDDWRSGVG